MRGIGLDFEPATTFPSAPVISAEKQEEEEEVFVSQGETRPAVSDPALLPVTIGRAAGHGGVLGSPPWLFGTRHTVRRTHRLAIRQDGQDSTPPQRCQEPKRPLLHLGLRPFVLGSLPCPSG